MLDKKEGKKIPNIIISELVVEKSWSLESNAFFTNSLAGSQF